MTKTKPEPVNPYINSNPISKGIFTWCLKFMYKVNAHGASAKMLFPPRYEDLCKELTDELRKRIYSNKPPFVNLDLCTIIWMYFSQSDYLQWFFLAIFGSVCLKTLAVLCLIYILQQVVELDMKDCNYLAGVGLLLIFFFVLCAVVCFLNHLNRFWTRWNGKRLQIGLTGLIYAKITKLPSTLVNKEKVHEIEELLFQDMNILTQFPAGMQDLPRALLQIIVYALILRMNMGVASSCGMLMYVFIALPIQALLTLKTIQMDVTIRSKRKTTIAIVCDMLAGIETLKMQCTIDIFLRMLHRASDREMRYCTRRDYTEMVSWLLGALWHRLACLLTVVLCVLNHEVPRFPSMMICFVFFEYVCVELFSVFKNTLTAILKTRRVLHDISEFLKLTEQWHNPRTDSPHGEILFENIRTHGTYWDASLQGVNLTIAQGKLTVICGQINSGCASIIPILMDELRLRTGRLCIGGTLSYYFKTSLIIDGTIKKNIILGNKMERRHYKWICKLCGLHSELRLMQDGDNCVMNAQDYWYGLKQKVMLARTLYTIANIYVFQEPPVMIVNSRGRLIFEDCITKYLSDMTRLVVSNQDYYVQRADKIYYFEDGRIRAEGTYKEVLKQVPDFELIIQHGIEENRLRDFTPVTITRHHSSRHLTLVAPTVVEQMKLRRNLAMFCKVGNATFVMVLLGTLMFAAGVLPYIASMYMLQYSSNITMRNISWTSHSQFHPNFSDFNRIFLGIMECRIYFILVMCLLPLYIFSYAMVAYLGQRRMRTLYRQLIRNILEKEITFFDESPPEVLYQVLSKDVYVIQESFPITFIGIIEACTIFLCPLIIFMKLAIILAAIYAVYLAFLMYCLTWFQKTSRRLLRLRHALKIGVMTNISETAEMMTLLRCNDLFGHQTKSFELTMNKHTTASFMTLTLNSAFQLWVTLLMIVLAITVVILFAMLHMNDNISGMVINIIMYNLVGLMLFSNNGVDDVYKMANTTMYLKKVHFFSDNNLEDTKSGLKYPKIWIAPPQIRFAHIRNPTARGGINMDIRSLTIAPGEHVALMGRALSGRRVLMKMLLRLYPHDGTIKLNHRLVDEINICTLRRNIFYVNTYTALFAPTVRFNLDPYNEYTDTAMWQALARFGLTPDITTLDSPVELNGQNIPINQKVLILFARATLQKSKVLIFDHIFESIPQETQEDLENLIYDQFEDCTLIFIESRLNYVMRCDRIVVLDRGHIMDEGIPRTIYDNSTNFLHTVIDHNAYVNTKKLTIAGYYHAHAAVQSDFNVLLEETLANADDENKDNADDDDDDDDLPNEDH